MRFNIYILFLMIFNLSLFASEFEVDMGYVSLSEKNELQFRTAIGNQNKEINLIIIVIPPDPNNLVGVRVVINGLYVGAFSFSQNTKQQQFKLNISQVMIKIIQRWDPNTPLTIMLMPVGDSVHLDVLKIGIEVEDKALME